jgi:rod shape-determining protein MreD
VSALGSDVAEVAEGRSGLLLLAVPVLAALAQLTWAPRLPGGGPLNVAVVAVAAWTWARGTRAGLWWALPAGLILDLGSAGALGPHALALLAAAYVAGLVSSTVDGGLVVLPLSAAAATLAYAATLLVVGALLRESSLHLQANLGWIVSTAVWDAILAPLAVLAVRRADRALAALRP